MIEFWEFNFDGIDYWVKGEFEKGERSDYFYPGSPDRFHIIEFEASEEDCSSLELLEEYILERYYES